MHRRLRYASRNIFFSVMVSARAWIGCRSGRASA
jgi:hypothetical protein